MATHKDTTSLLWQSHHPRWHQGPSVKPRRRRKVARSTQQDLQSDTPMPSNRVLRGHGLWGNWLLLPLVMISYLPCEAWGATFKIALVGPWTCDPLYSKALPDLAARLAVSRMNKDPTLNKGYWYDYTLINEDCQTSRALAQFAELEGYGSAFLGPANPGYCSSAALLTKNWNVGLLSWACLSAKMEDDVFPTFTRPLPLSSRVLFAVLRFFRWAHVSIVSEESDIWEATGQELASSLRSLGLPVSTVVTMETDKEGPRRALQKVRNADRVRVVIMCMNSVLFGGEAQYNLLTTATHMRMIDRGYIFIPYDTLLYPLPYKNVSYPVLANDTKLRRAYDAVLTITIDQEEQNFYEAFKEAQDSSEIRSPAAPEQVSPFFATIYNMLYYTGMAVEQSRAAGGGRWVTGDALAMNEGNFEFNGFNQHVSSGKEGEGMQVRYVVLDTDGVSSSLYRTHTLEASHTFAKFGALKYMGKSIHFAGASPSTNPNCWFSSYVACSGGERYHSATLHVFNQLCYSTSTVGSTPKLVLTLDDLVFINTQLSKKVCNSFSFFFYLVFFSASVQLRDMRQENLNLFLGLFLDSGIFGIVVEHCTRGSLEDLLNNEDMRLDWMFKSSLLLDLVRGMKYLHHRAIIHGRLKSRNCVVDGRFVLKVTDYGLNEIMISQNISQEESKPEDLLWTSPELLRSAKLMKTGTYPGDVYSFSIIMQEVISRSAPFCMLDMPPQEIVDKVRSPPPLCRPTVSVDEAPLEVIQLMKQAWSKEPDLRPTFEEIFKQFKTISKGKKTNIIDSMLRMLEQYSTNLEDLIRERTEELEVERQKTDALVAQMLPKSVALALKTGKPVVPEHFSEVTLYFSDIVGFTTISALSDPIEVVDLLNDLYTSFDSIIGMHDVYKVETIGDAYMVASGVPNRNGKRHAAEMANMSLDILSCIGTFKMRHMPTVKVRIRIGLHSGPVVAGVVGLTMPRYCLFGDTVNTASRMESTGLSYRIHMNISTVNVLRELNLGYKIDSRGKTELKGKGVEETYWLVGREGFDKPLPIYKCFTFNFYYFVLDYCKSLWTKASAKCNVM
uniref:Guanylate cyclase n=1 Tax=Astyanax mexicanus TaxID=7994 RepID=A0A8B9JCQ6_ASTMX